MGVGPHPWERLTFLSQWSLVACKSFSRDGAHEIVPFLYEHAYWYCRCSVLVDASISRRDCLSRQPGILTPTTFLLSLLQCPWTCRFRSCEGSSRIWLPTHLLIPALCLVVISLWWSPWVVERNFFDDVCVHMHVYIICVCIDLYTLCVYT